jgi:trehalose 2-sulfotransferase
LGKAVNYILCSSPRSGSTLLAQALAAMGAGHPGEYLNRALVGAPGHSGPDDFMRPTPAAYVERLRREHTVNGVFGLKTHYADLVRYPEICDNLGRLFPDAEYISITRRNVLRQALSAARAAQTMAWTSHLLEKKYPRFRYGAALKHVVRTLREVELWERFYAAHGVKPLRVLYEDLDEDYHGTMRKVVDFLGVSGSVPPPPLRKQADATTEEWVERFLQAFRGRGPVSRAVRFVTRRW